MSVFRALLPVDAKNVARDPLLAWIGILPFALALLYRLVPLLREALLTRFAFDLEPYYPLIAGSFVTSAPGIAGMVVGFLLLDERDDGVLAAVAVTPVAPASYFAYRLAAPAAVGFLTTIAAYPIVGFLPLPLGDLLAIAAIASPIAPFTALFLGTFAENKVAGFAMVKVLNVIGIAPVAAWWFEVPLQWVAGIAPSYWPMKMLWLAAAGQGWGEYAVAGVIATAATLAALLAWFRRRTTSGG